MLTCMLNQQNEYVVVGPLGLDRIRTCFGMATHCSNVLSFSFVTFFFLAAGSFGFVHNVSATK